MLSDVLLINKNSVELYRNTPIDVSGGSLDSVADIVDNMESKPDTFAGGSDTE